MMAISTYILSVTLIYIRIFRGHCSSLSNAMNFNRSSSNVHDSMQKLMAALFVDNRYDKATRPVRNTRNPVDVWLKLNLRKISEVNTPSQYMSMNLWVLEAWKDEYLDWDPANYDGIDRFFVSQNDIWTPDINLENNLRPNYLHNERRAGVTAKILDPEELKKLRQSSYLNITSPTGYGAMMFFSYPATYKFMCHMNVAMFPFDTQTCSMIFGSWNYFDDQLKFWPFNYDGSWDVDLDGFTNNSQWTVVSFKMEPVLVRSDIPGKMHASVRATIVLKRQAVTYMVTLICPTLLTTFASLVGFFMPTSSGGQRREKMTLGINSLLTMSILLMGVSDQVPCTSTSLPLIGIFYVGIIVISAISTLCTTFVISFQRNWLNYNLTVFGVKLSLVSTASSTSTRKVVEKTHFKTQLLNLYRVADLLGIKRPDKVGLDICNELIQVSKDHQSNLQSLTASGAKQQSSKVTSPESSYVEELATSDILSKEISSLYQHPDRKSSSDFDRNLSEFSRRLDHVCRNLAVGQRRRLLAMEWDWLADVLDRLFLVFWLTIFGIFIFVLIVVAFYS